MKQNITISVDETTLKRARQLAAKRNLSVSRLLAEDLAERVGESRRYRQARRQALAWLDAGLDLGSRYLTRDQAHERG